MKFLTFLLTISTIGSAVVGAPILFQPNGTMPQIVFHSNGTITSKYTAALNKTDIEAIIHKVPNATAEEVQALTRRACSHPLCSSGDRSTNDGTNVCVQRP